MKNELKEKLNIWCEESSTTFSTVYFEIEKNIIYIKRYDGNSRQNVIQKFKNEYEVEKFLNENQKNKDDLDCYNRMIEKEMMM